MARRPDARKGDRHRKTEARKRDRHRARRKSDRVIAWDGESATLATGPEYILLLSSAGDRACDAAGLDTVTCLETLLSSAQAHPGALHVGFAFTYDANMILRDLPETALIELWQTNRVWWRGYSITYRQRKEFAVKHERTNRKVRVWDVFGFFQASFVDALRAWSVGTPEQVERIARMKEQRPDFDPSDMPEIERYCSEECTLLEVLVRTLRERAAEADVALARWDGAGAIAGALFNREGVKAFKQRQPKRVERSAQAAYYGGRIECIRFGHHKGKVWAHDLRSAYPAALRHLPCLTCAEWNEGERTLHASDFALYEIEWTLRGEVLPFPWRDRYGAVYFPRTGRGWYWAPEVRAALAAQRTGLVSGRIEIRDSLVPTIACDHEPFAWVPRVYDQRAQWKRDGIGAEKILKLGLNSLYGKCAQRVGGRRGPPTWHQIEWAGWVTSRTRATLYESSFPAIASGALLFYATDAIVATERLDLCESSALGAWEIAEHDSATLVQSGVYWLGQGEREIEHTRGFRRGELSRAQVLDTWRAKRYEIAHNVRRFMGIGLAIAGKQGNFRAFVDQVRTLRMEPTGTKRESVRSLAGLRPASRLESTRPADVSYWQREGWDSTPIKLPWQTGEEAGWEASSFYNDLDAATESDDGWE